MPLIMSKVDDTQLGAYLNAMVGSSAARRRDNKIAFPSVIEKYAAMLLFS